MGEKGVRKGGYAYVSLDDHEIIDLLFARKEEGIRELDEKYGKLCGRLALHVLGDPEDAEECVNDAYLAVWKSIPPNRPYSLKAYICRLVRTLSINRRKYNPPSRHILRSFLMAWMQRAAGSSCKGSGIWNPTVILPNPAGSVKARSVSACRE